MANPRPIEPKIPAGLKSYSATFRDPHRAGRLVSARLGTRDETEAKLICRDLDFFRRHANPKALTRAELLLRRRRAVEVYFGADSKQARWVAGGADAGPSADALLYVGQVLNGVFEHVDLTDAQVDQVANAMLAYVGTATAEKDEELTRLRDRLAVLEPEHEDLKREVRELKAKQNLHVRERLDRAVERWLEEHRAGRKPATARKARTCIESFMAHCAEHGKTQLGQVEGADVSAWLAKLPGKALTRRDYRAVVSGFFGWACRRWEMGKNPMAFADKVAGVSKRPERIVAIRRLADLHAFLKALEPEPYWRAAAAVGCLAGPRYAELVWLRIEDVYLEDGYLRITSRAGGRGVSGTKTGRERNVPIERKVLHPILKAHLAARQKERKAKRAGAEQRSPWLFPNLADAGPIPRRLTEPGQWSDNGVFLRAWGKVADALTGRGIPEAEPEGGWPERPAYWEYGPREWRHTAGCVMGQSGVSTLRISDWLGNSEDVARRHYIPPPSGERWPFEYGTKG